MKILFVMYLVLFCNSLWANTGQEVWKRADLRDKVRLVNQYKEFYLEWHEQNTENLSEFKTTSRFAIFISEAWASELNCIYAGWPSQRVNNLCSSPQKKNPSYEQGACGSNQMQCQPLLFGKGQCVSVASQKERNLAFTNCDKKFQAGKKHTSDVVKEIISEGKENELFELMSFADNICKTGAQAQTGMCNRLKNAIARVKDSFTSNAEITVKKFLAKKDSPEVVIQGEKIPGNNSEKKAILKTVEKVTQVVTENKSPAPGLEICEPEDEGSPFERSVPRDGVVDYVTSRRGEEPYWEDTFKKYDGEKEERPSGFKLKNIGPNSIAVGPAIDPSLQVERGWHFVSDDNSRRETYLWITDDSGSGYLSHLMETVIMIVPRKVMPSVEVVGDDLQVTLSTGEKIIYDKETRVIKSGVLSEGKVDMNPDRFKKKFASVKYSGSGISIRVDKRGEDPRLIPGNATVTQNGKSCQVPAKELWDSKAQFKYAEDDALVNYLNSKCGKKFSL